MRVGEGETGRVLKKMQRIWRDDKSPKRGAELAEAVTKRSRKTSPSAMGRWGEKARGTVIYERRDARNQIHLPTGGRGAEGERSSICKEGRERGDSRISMPPQARG